ncbi:hypothetical protein HK105_208094 [Polyrhizophydium stewartii]|uniref:Uncharacterized protein n=1 Tax=Polyrhizophydium stewartii TaxID=2732419 RepID=A0ABR4MYX7_9FUNG
MQHGAVQSPKSPCTCHAQPVGDSTRCLFCRRMERGAAMARRLSCSKAADAQCTLGDQSDQGSYAGSLNASPDAPEGDRGGFEREYSRRSSDSELLGAPHRSASLDSLGRAAPADWIDVGDGGKAVGSPVIMRAVRDHYDVPDMLPAPTLWRELDRDHSLRGLDFIARHTETHRRPPSHSLSC